MQSAARLMWNHQSVQVRVNTYTKALTLSSLGGTPYPALDTTELLKLLREGYRMEKPDTCSDEL